MGVSLGLVRLEAMLAFDGPRLRLSGRQTLDAGECALCGNPFAQELVSTRKEPALDGLLKPVVGDPDVPSVPAPKGP